MANITPVDNWGTDVYQWADGDVLDGGPESLEVLPIKQLANRSLFQRLRGVTPWNADLAAAFGYPAFACVMHDGVSWRAKVPNNVEPGTDATKWERWGFSASELNQFLTTVKAYTDEEKEQAQANIALPVEHIEVDGCNTVLVPNNLVYTTLPFTGGAVIKTGGINIVGSNIVVAKSGLYSISCRTSFITTGEGIVAASSTLFINNAIKKLLSASVQDKYTAPGAGQGYVVNASGMTRLNVGDLLVVKAVQQTAAGTSLNTSIEGISVTRVAI